MKNIIRIARNDIHNIRKNVIALIVIFGITIVPSLYAWFNIAASWDPYKNTGNLKVAVASLDKGYDGELLPVRLNLGNDIISSLRENTQLHWIFTVQMRMPLSLPLMQSQTGYKLSSTDIHLLRTL